MPWPGVETPGRPAATPSRSPNLLPNNRAPALGGVGFGYGEGTGGGALVHRFLHFSAHELVVIRHAKLGPNQHLDRAAAPAGHPAAQHPAHIGLGSWKLLPTLHRHNRHLRALVIRVNAV